MKTNLILSFIASSILTACAQPNSIEPDSSKSHSSSGIGSGGVTYPGGVNGTGGTPNLVTPGQGVTSTAVIQVSQYSQAIKNGYDSYLPNCYNSVRANFWEQWFARGGLMSDFLATMKIVATGTTCSSNGNEVTTDPHYIKGYFDFYLPGCYTPEKDVFFQAWFARGGIDSDFQAGLLQVRNSSPRPSCLTN